jgi:hypothetical protein
VAFRLQLATTLDVMTNAAKRGRFLDRQYFFERQNASPDAKRLWQ